MNRPARATAPTARPTARPTAGRSRTPSRPQRDPRAERARAALAGAALALGAAAGPVAADDTEVFFGQLDRESDVYPNVLFVLDTSGSMAARDGQSRSRMQRLQEAMIEIIDASENVNIGLMSLNGSLQGGPVRYPVTPIDARICEHGDCDNQTIYQKILRVEDDTEEVRSNGEPRANGLFLTVGNNGGEREVDDEQRVGLRFRDLNVPQGARIVSARLEMSSSFTDRSAVTVRYSGEDVGDAHEFDGSPGDLRARRRTTAEAFQPMPDWIADRRYRSAELAPILQEIVDRPDWCGGNALALFMESETTVTDGGRSPQSLEFELGYGANGTQAQNPARIAPAIRIVYSTEDLATDEGCMTRTAVARVSASDDDVEERTDDDTVYREGNTLETPRVIDGGNSRDQVIGLRFPGLEVPADADVLEARIEFEIQARGQGSGSPRVLIRGDASTDVPPFGGARRAVSGRASTSATALWENIPDADPGTKVRTADLAPIVQEIVDAPGWRSGNALGMHLLRAGGPSANRKFDSWNRERAAAPRLLVRYRAALGDAGDARVPTLTARDELKRIVAELDTYGGTPLPGVQYEAARYLLGLEVDYGRRRGQHYVWSNTQTHDMQERYNLSHPDSYVGGTVERPPGCTADNPRARACRDERIVDGGTPAVPTYRSPMATSCLASHVVLLSDGEATTDSPTSRIRDLAGLAGCAAGNGERSYNDAELCGVDLAAWLYENDHNGSVAETQNVITHTVAFNLDASRRYYLRDVAAAGGGGAYTAESAGDLVAVFDSILKNVLSIDTGFTAPGATVNQFNRLTHREDIYFALFRPESTPRWDGNLKRYRVGGAPDRAAREGATDEIDIRGADGEIAVNPETGFFVETANSYWTEFDMDGRVVTAPDGARVRRGGAATRLETEGPRARRLYTWLGERDDIPAGGVDLTADAQRFHESNARIDTVALGLVGRHDDEAHESAYRRALIRWVRGLDILDRDEDGDRDEPRLQIGDPMHTAPVIVNYGEAPGPADGDARFGAVDSTVFVATNEGVLHAIDGTTGDERWSFTPKELLANHDVFFRNDANDTRPYGLDGPLSLWRIDPEQDFVVTEGSEDRAYLYLGMRRGGRGYYALDVTDPDVPRLVWTVRGGEGDFAELGQSWSRATPARLRIDGVARDTVVFTGGYDTAQDPSRDPNGRPLPPTHEPDGVGRALYVVDARTGELLHTLGSVEAALPGTGGFQGFEAMTHSMPGNVRVVDVDLDGFADQLYAADAGGQVWRFDVDPYHGTGGGAAPLFTAGVIAELAGDDPVDHRRFYNEPDVALIERGGERFMAVSIGSGWRAHPLDRTVRDRMYTLKVPATRGVGGPYGKPGPTGVGHVPVTEADLVNVAEHDVPPSGRWGWMLALPEEGEKVLAKSVTFDNQVVFSTYLPDGRAEACTTALGGSRVYVLDVLTGAPSRDFDGSGQIEGHGGTAGSPRVGADARFDLAHGGIPPEPAVLISESGEPLLVVGPEKVPADLENITRRTFWADTGPAGPGVGGAGARPGAAVDAVEAAAEAATDAVNASID